MLSIFPCTGFALQQRKRLSVLSCTGDESAVGSSERVSKSYCSNHHLACTMGWLSPRPVMLFPPPTTVPNRQGRSRITNITCCRRGNVVYGREERASALDERMCVDGFGFYQWLMEPAIGGLFNWGDVLN